MKKIQISVLSLLILAGLFLVPAGARSQTLEEAGAAYNSAAELIKTDLPGAIMQFKNCIAIAEKLGDEGNELKANASAQIPGLYYNHAVALQSGGNLDEAIQACTDAMKAADEYSNPEIKEKAKNLASQIFLVKGNGSLKAKDMDNALTHFDKALEFDPGLTRAYYGKLMVYREKELYPEMEAAFAKMKEVSSADEDIVSKTQVVISKTYSVAAAKSIKAGKASLALEYSDKAIGYGDSSANTFYYKALAANMEKKWDIALEAAQKALDLEQKDKNKIYFEIGKAWEGKGNSAEACAAYKNVAAGPYVQNAQYQMKQVLKCK